MRCTGCLLYSRCDQRQLDAMIACQCPLARLVTLEVDRSLWRDPNSSVIRRDSEWPTERELELYCSAVIQIPPCKFNKRFVFCINAVVEFKCPLYCDSQATFRLFRFYCDLPNPLGPEYLSQTNLDRCGFVFRVAFMQNSPKKFIQNSLPFLNKFTNQYLKWNRNNVKFGKFLLYLIYTISL